MVRGDFLTGDESGEPLGNALEAGVLILLGGVLGDDAVVGIVGVVGVLVLGRLRLDESLVRAMAVKANAAEVCVCRSSLAISRGQSLLLLLFSHCLASGPGVAAQEGPLTDNCR